MSGILQGMVCRFEAETAVPIQEIDIEDLKQMATEEHAFVGSAHAQGQNIDLDHCTPRHLLRAAQLGDIYSMEQILRPRPHWVNHVTYDGKLLTVLMVATLNGNKDIVKFLVEKGARVDTENVNGVTAAMAAGYGGYNEILKYLLSKGAQVTKSKASVLYETIRGGSKECLDTVLSKCTVEDVQWQIQGRSPFYTAVSKNDKYALEQLLKKDPDGISRVTREDKQTLLHIAAFSKSADMIEFILSKKGLDINAMDWTGRTPVALSAGLGYLKAVKCLLSSGADVTIKTKDGRSSLHLACINLNRLSIVSTEVLKEMPFIPLANIHDCISGYLEIVSILLANGCSVDDLDFDGDTPEDFLTDSNIKAAVLARAKKVFKTTFTVDIKGDKETAGMETVRNQTLASLLPSMTQETTVAEYLPHRATMTSDIVEHLSYIHTNQFVLNEYQELQHVCDIFASHGAIITDIAKGSVQLDAVITSESQLERVKKAFESGELQRQMSESMITEEKTREAGCELHIDLRWNPKEMERGQKFFEASMTSDKISAEIDHTGGEIVVAKTGVKLQIPPGAIAEGDKEKLTVTVLWEGERAPMQDNVCIIAPNVLLEPEGKEFLMPVTLTVPHFADRLSPKRLQVWQKHGWNEKWEPFLDGGTEPARGDIQVTSNEIKIQMNHFTIWEFYMEVDGHIVGQPEVERAEEVLRFMHVYMRSVQDRWLVKICTNLNETSKQDHEGFGKCADSQPFSVNPNEDVLLEIKLDTPCQGWSIEKTQRTIRKTCICKGNSKTQLWIRKDDSTSSEQRSLEVDGCIIGKMMSKIQLWIKKDDSTSSEQRSPEVDECNTGKMSKIPLWIRKDDSTSSEQRSLEVDGCNKGSMSSGDEGTIELLDLPFGTSLM